MRDQPREGALTTAGQRLTDTEIDTMAKYAPHYGIGSKNAMRLITDLRAARAERDELRTAAAAVEAAMYAAIDSPLAPTWNPSTQHLFDTIRALVDAAKGAGDAQPWEYINHDDE